MAREQQSAAANRRRGAGFLHDRRLRRRRYIARNRQVKHGRSRHEKDDRRRVDDRSNWVLGFDNREKLALFRTQAQGLADRIESLKAEISGIEEGQSQREKRFRSSQTLANLTWQDIDTATLASRIQSLGRQILQVREGSDDLRALAAAIEAKRGAIDDAREKRQVAEAQVLGIDNEIRGARDKLAKVRGALPDVPAPPGVVYGLDRRFAEAAREITLGNLDKAATSVMKALSEEIETLAERIADAGTFVRDRFQAFVRDWPAESEGLDPSLEASPDFFAKLDRLEGDRLPQFESKFFELLQSQSQQNLAALAAHLTQERKTILDRMIMVNEGLTGVPFNTMGGARSYLCIDVSDRHLEDVKAFRQDIQAALRDAFGDDREAAEARFLELRRLVRRLSSQDPADRRWRETALDVRQHVEFIGREFDEDGRELEVYRSGAGKSGGQRQKLATTCLAAALRYQLGGHDRALPAYAAVVLDEAFDKADSEFTRLSMDVFLRFGFQMIVATPLKSVMTLEPYIGGACFVDISDRKRSSALHIEYDDELGRLRWSQATHLAVVEEDGRVFADETA